MENYRFDKFEEVLDALDANLVVLDDRGRIIFTNNGWRKFAAGNPLTDGSLPGNVGLGSNYLAVCECATGNSSNDALLVRDGIRAVLDGKKRKFSHEYPCHSPTTQRWFMMNARLLARTFPRQVVVAHIDITARYLSELRLHKRQQVLEAAFHQFQNVASGTKDALRDTESVTVPNSTVSRMIESREATGFLDKLSKRELEIFWGLVRGERNSSMADRLKLSRKSVTTYRSRIFEKLRVDNIADLIALANRTAVQMQSNGR